MRRYGPRRGRRVVNKGRLGLVIGVAAAVVVVAVVSVNLWGSKAGGADETASARMTFDVGVSVGGQSVAGLTMEEAKIAVSPAVNRLMSEGEIVFTLPAKDVAAPSGADGEDAEGGGADEPAPRAYSVTPEELGVAVDTESALRQAMLFEQPEDLPEDENGNPVIQQIDFPLEKTADQSVIAAKLEELSARDEWDLAPVDTSWNPRTYKDEEEKITGGEMVRGEPRDGFRVKTEEMAGIIAQQIGAGQYAPFDAPVEALAAKNAEDSGKEYIMMASATTEYRQEDPEGRRFNIWKISDKLNGAAVYAGEEFSVNDYVGPRSAETGWMEAPGIEDGNLTPQYGGGICQVSTTLYNAVLKAELKPTGRVPHTIASYYVDKGLDATISTDGPDFKFENTLEDPVYIIVKNNDPEREVTVEIWGTRERDYYLKLHTKMISEETEVEPPPEYAAATPALTDPYAVEEQRRGRRYEQWQVYADKYDSETDELIEENIEVTTSTYRAIPGRYGVSAAIPMPANGTPLADVQAQLANARAAVDAAAAAAAAPPPETPTPTPDPNAATSAPPEGGQPPAA